MLWSFFVQTTQASGLIDNVYTCGIISDLTLPCISFLRLTGQKQMSLLYGLRIAVCHELQIPNGPGWDVDGGISFVSAIQATPLINRISHMVGLLRKDDSKRPSISRRYLDSHDNIVVDDVVFLRKIYERLIPKIFDSLKSLIDQSFQGGLYKDFLDCRRTVMSSSDIDEINLFSDDGHSGTSLQELLIRDFPTGFPKVLMERLTASVVFVIHGLGGGVSREATVLGISKNVFLVRNGFLYYHLGSDKQGSINARTSVPTLKKMPMMIGRLVLLYRVIVRKVGIISNEKFFPTLENPTITMGDVAADIFETKNKVDCRILRQFWCSFCNRYFNQHSAVLTAVPEIAQFCGHTPRTHQEHYSTMVEPPKLSEERFFDLLHRLLGDSVYSHGYRTTHRNTITANCRLKALGMLLGVESPTYRSQLQEEFIEKSCNDHIHHRIAILPPGAGKSMSVLIPQISEALTGQAVTARILVLPMVSLLGHLHSKMKAQLQRCCGERQDLSVASILTSDFPDSGSLPAKLQGLRLPSVILFSLESFALFVKRHPHTLQQWREQDLVSSITIDEAQTILSEFLFRGPRYDDAFRDLSRFGIPVTAMTGSMTPDLLPFFNDFLGLGPATDYLFGDNIVGEDISLLVETIGYVLVGSFATVSFRPVALISSCLLVIDLMHRL